MSSEPIVKDGKFVSETMLTWCRRRPCASCGSDPPSDPHHWPPKGMGGARHDDTSVIPLCRACHELAQRYAPPLTMEWQHFTVVRALFDFAHTATDKEWDAFAEERRRWYESRTFMVPM